MAISVRWHISAVFILYIGDVLLRCVCFSDHSGSIFEYESVDSTYFCLVVFARAGNGMEHSWYFSLDGRNDIACVSGQCEFCDRQ